MISCDTNILFAACDADSPRHAVARAFLLEHGANPAFVLAEQVLMELYVLLRNPAVSHPPLDGAKATGIIRAFRTNPQWRLVDVPADGSVMEDVWRFVARAGFAYRRIFDVRLALTLRHHGVTEFATANLRDFDGLGFARVWDPLKP